jgi:5-methylcytosine-specific restriction endonuclease McrA
MWHLVRQQVIDRDKACRLCGAGKSPSGRSLDVHHRDARRNFLMVDVANDLSNLIALCAPCHGSVEAKITHGRTADLPKWLRPRV